MTKFTIKDGDNFKEIDALLQPEVDAVVKDRVKRVEAKYADYDQLKAKSQQIDELNTKHQTEIDSLTAKLAETNKAVESARLETAKIKAMRDFNIKDNLGEFISGTTEDELRAKAERLSKEIPSGQISVEKTATPTSETSKRGSTAQVAHNLFGKSDD